MGWLPCWFRYLNWVRGSGWSPRQPLEQRGLGWLGSKRWWRTGVTAADWLRELGRARAAMERPHTLEVPTAGHSYSSGP